MYVEPLQNIGLLELDLPDKGWDDGWEEPRRDGVLLAAADLRLRRDFLDSRTPVVLSVSTSDVLLAGMSWNCVLGYPPCPLSPDIGDVFLFAGDVRKWRNRAPEQFGDPESYLDLAGQLGQAAADRWGLDADVDRYRRLQALLWSVQSVRAQGFGPSFEEILARVGLPGGPALATY